MIGRSYLFGTRATGQHRTDPEVIGDPVVWGPQIRMRTYPASAVPMIAPP